MSFGVYHWGKPHTGQTTSSAIYLWLSIVRHSVNQCPHILIHWTASILQCNVIPFRKGNDSIHLVWNRGGPIAMVITWYMQILASSSPSPTIMVVNYLVLAPSPPPPYPSHLPPSSSPPQLLTSPPHSKPLSSTPLHAPTDYEDTSIACDHQFRNPIKLWKDQQSMRQWYPSAKPYHMHEEQSYRCMILHGKRERSELVRAFSTSSPQPLPIIATKQQWSFRGLHHSKLGAHSQLWQAVNKGREQDVQ